MTASHPLVDAASRLRRATRDFDPGPPVAYVYRPLDYAWAIARRYCETYGGGPKEMLLVGMNPGPFGMGQTGVPFGEVSLVRDWMGIDGAVRSPERVHPKRPVQGFDCARSEVSGKRLWGAIAERYPDPRAFFERAFVVNYCPLLFVGESGANITPDKLSKDARATLEAACGAHLQAVIRALEPRFLFGVGAYASQALRRATGDQAPVFTVPHPSPASPLANRGWTALARKAFEDAGVASPV
ncbi:MAG: single-stranded DNA-binding protein [Myxococcales bacterium]|nr:single-stranded DNA-binding protein [Myxococcales bacterium]